METKKRARYVHVMEKRNMTIKVNGEPREIWFQGGMIKGGRTNGGVFNTSDPDEMAALERHPDFGRKFFKDDEQDVKVVTASQAPQVILPKPVDEAPTESDSPSALQVGDEVNTIQKAKDFLNKNFGVAQTEVNTAVKIKEWLAVNPGKVQFNSTQLQGLYQ